MRTKNKAVYSGVGEKKTHKGANNLLYVRENLETKVARVTSVTTREAGELPPRD